MPKSPVRRAEHRRTVARLRELDERRAAHRRLREAYLAADGVLRAATREAKGRSRYEWMQLPAIGDHLHGRSKDPGTPARYGVDVEAQLRRDEGVEMVPAPAAVSREALVTAS